MSTRIFRVELNVVVELFLDDQVIDTVDDDWRKTFYLLRTPEQIAEHIAYNLVINKSSLSQLDGWADQPNDNAQVKPYLGWETEAEERT